MSVPTESNADEQVLAEFAGEMADDWGTEDAEGIPSDDQAPAAEGEAAPAAEARREPSGEEDLERFLDRPIPADPRYPKILHGQPFRKIIERQSHADELIQRQGEEKNRALEQMGVLQTAVRVLTEKLRTAQPAPPPASDFDPERDVIDDPKRFAHGTVEMARRALEPKLQELESQLAETQGKIVSFEEQQRRDAVQKAAEEARESLGVDPALWRQAGNYMWAYAGNKDPFQPESWKEAWEGLQSIFPSAPKKDPVPRVGMTSGAAPGATRSASVTAPGAKTIKPRVRSFIADTVAVAGLPPEIAEEIELGYRATFEQGGKR